MHIFTDGSCSNPSHPTTRHAAYACVLDLCPDDAARQQQVQRWCSTGQPFDCFQTIAVGRVHGEQTINRAELSALIVVGDLGDHVHLHTDSAYAKGVVGNIDPSHLPTPSNDGNLDLRLRLRSTGLQPACVHKVAAHTDPSIWDPWWTIFCAMGNAAADAAAKVANDRLQPQWKETLEERHGDVQTQRDLFYDTCRMVLKLNDARAAAAKQLQPEEQPALACPNRFSPLDIQQRLANWSPVECQSLTFPEDIDNWVRPFSWGDEWLHTMLRWLQQFAWPSSPGGPLTREVGISWVELGLSLSLFAGRLLPIIRKESADNVRLIGVWDATDAVHYGVTYVDLATMVEKMWSQLQLWAPSAYPVVNRGRITSLQCQGFGQHCMGLVIRPRYPFQDRITELVQPLRGKTGFNVTISPTWCTNRTAELRNDDWLALIARFRHERRCAKRQGVSPF
eukprot:Skav206375  [mRNA]  locus=scaffold834:215804:217156:+ [translate_table: standard]